MICPPREADLANTSKCLMVKKGAHLHLISKLKIKVIVELVSEKLKDINGSLGIPND